jgi:hypothetical protein
MQGFVYSVALAQPLTKVMPQADIVELRFHLLAERAEDGRARA